MMTTSTRVEDAEPTQTERVPPVDAVKWNGRGFTLDGGPPKWLLAAVQSLGTPDKVVGAALRMRDEVHIGTRFGVMIARPGDWIVRYSDNEIVALTDFEYSMSGIEIALSQGAGHEQ